MDKVPSYFNVFLELQNDSIVRFTGLHQSPFAPGFTEIILQYKIYVFAEYPATITTVIVHKKNPVIRSLSVF